MNGCKVDLDQLRTSLVTYLDAEFKNLVTDGADDAKPTAALQRVIQRAVMQVQSSDRAEVTGADVLIAIFAERESHAAYFLQEQDLSRSDAVSYISRPYWSAPSSRSPIDAEIQSNSRETTPRVLASLTAREERVLRMRFGIGTNTDHTLEQVGQQFSVPQERIRQIEAKALRKLKHPLRSGKPRSRPEPEAKGKPRQGFSHGRTKKVVVEKIKRRRPPRDGKPDKTPPAPPK